MYTSAFALGGLLALRLTTSIAIAAPSSGGEKEYVIEERHVIVEEKKMEKRQADVSQLLELASLAGITSLPTDPAILLSLGPLANSLAAALPTPSVLSVLVTAAPSTFVSAIINDPAYANSFESAFSDGSSPGWFTALPTDVKSYLHTYSGFGQLAGAAGAVKGEVSATGGGNSTGGSGSSTSGRGSGSSVPAPATTGTSGSMATVTSSTTGGGGGGGGGASSSSAGAASAGGASSTSSHAGAAAGPTGAMAAGIVGVVGILGAVAAL